MNKDVPTYTQMCSVLAVLGSRAHINRKSAPDSAYIPHRSTWPTCLPHPRPQASPWFSARVVLAVAYTVLKS